MKRAKETGEEHTTSSSSPTNDLNKKLTQGIQVLLILVIVMAVLLGWNMYQIHQLREIESGEYYTKEECDMMCSPAFITANNTDEAPEWLHQ